MDHVSAELKTLVATLMILFDLFNYREGMVASLFSDVSSFSYALEIFSTDLFRKEYTVHFLIKCHFLML
jgi:hypothetical protein